MSYRITAALTLLLLSPQPALDGQPGIHDPSTIVVHDGKYYTYGTGAGLPISVSDDGWTWRRAGNVDERGIGRAPATSSRAAATTPGRRTSSASATSTSSTTLRPGTQPKVGHRPAHWQDARP